MWILPLVGYLGVILGFSFLTLAIGTSKRRWKADASYFLEATSPDMRALPNPATGSGVAWSLRNYALGCSQRISADFSVASGLYYLSELVEEHTVLAKRLLSRLIYAVMALQILLLVDGFPFWLSLLSVGSHAVYMQNLRRFPVVKLTDPLFLSSCGTSPLATRRGTLSPSPPTHRTPRS
jgi:hypothetical protein